MLNVEAVRDSIKEDINRLTRAYELLGGIEGLNGNGRKRGGARRMSASARKRIAAAQRARWAKWKKNKKAA